jgi:hypothetical protein
MKVLILLLALTASAMANANRPVSCISTCDPSGKICTMQCY